MSLFNTYLKDSEFQEPNDRIYYLVTEDGIFLVKKTNFFSSKIKVSGIRGLLGQENEAVLQLPKKMPSNLFFQVVSFFREVFRLHKSEAIVLVYWDDESESYKIVAPEQKVTPASCKHEIARVPKSYRLVMDIHSHAKMSAFHSDTDIRDEKHQDGLHITIGNLDSLVSISCEILTDGYRKKINIAEVVDMPVSEFPAEWVKHVAKDAITVKYSKKSKLDEFVGLTNYGRPNSRASCMDKENNKIMPLGYESIYPDRADFFDRPDLPTNEFRAPTGSEED